MSIRYTLAGAAGGYVWGFVTGLFHSMGIQASLGLAGYTLLAGLLTGAVGSLIFKWIKSPSLIGMTARFALLGMLFFGSASIFYPEYASELAFFHQPFKAMIGGMVGGSVTGLLMWLFGSNAKALK